MPGTGTGRRTAPLGIELAAEATPTHHPRGRRTRRREPPVHSGVRACRVPPGHRSRPTEQAGRVDGPPPGTPTASERRDHRHHALNAEVNGSVAEFWAKNLC